MSMDKPRWYDGSRWRNPQLPPPTPPLPNILPHLPGFLPKYFTEQKDKTRNSRPKD